MSDNNYPPGGFHDITGESHSGIILVPPDHGQGYDDIFKTSHVTGCTFEDVTVIAGEQIENAWDANRYCIGNKFLRLKLDAGQECAVYRKCGFKHNLVDDLVITRVGGHSDWFDGDYSDQGGEKCSGNTQNNVRRIDGRPVRVRWTFLRSEKPRFSNSNVRYQYLWSLVSTVYVELKYLWVWKWNYLKSFQPIPQN